MFKINFYSLALYTILCFILLQGCETEVELLAPYEETPVIYGVLDFSADTQFVRINKTFLGEGNPSQYSAIKDSVEYAPEEVEANIIKRDENGNELAVYRLESIDIPTRSPGIFYDEEVQFFFTDQPLFSDEELNLNGFDPSEFSFELQAIIKGETYSATTNFPGISPATITFPSGGSTVAQLAFASGNNILTFSTVRFTFTADNITDTYAGVLRLNFNYEDLNGNYIENQFIDFSLGEFTPTQPTFSTNILGENYYTFLSSQFDLIPDISRIELTNVEVKITGAPEELSTYINVVQPVSEFSPTLSTFTNINNGAIGLFTSVGSVTRLAFLNASSVEMLKLFEGTGKYNYCVLDDGDNDGIIWSNDTPCTP